MQRVFQGPRGVARIHRRTDELAPGFFDEPDQLPGLHVTCVILHRNLHPGIEREAGDVLQDTDRLGDARFDTAVALPVIYVSQYATSNRGTECPSDADGEF